MPDVNFIVDGKTLTAPAGQLLIEACKNAGIEIPAFCYYPGLSLQAACRHVVRLSRGQGSAPRHEGRRLGVIVFGERLAHARFFAFFARGG